MRAARSASSSASSPARGSGRTYAGLSSEERAERRRTALVAAGLDVLGTEGYRAATVRGVCGRAGLTDRYFYESFPNMEALLIAVYRDCTSAFAVRLEAVLTDPAVASDARARVRAGLASFFDWVADARVARVCWQEVLGVSPEVDRLYISTLRRFAGVLLGVVRDAHPGWRIDDDEAEVVAVAATGALSQAALDWLIGDYRTPRATMIAATSRILLALLTSIESDSDGPT